MFVFGILQSTWATHNRSGSITYRHISGNTYEFIVKTCTKTSSEADRNELEITYGDGERDTIPRVETVFNALYDIQENTYKGIHTYVGPGNYIVRVQDPNRNGGVINIVNSINQIFCIQTDLVISPFIGTPNNSIVIEDCPCPEFACLNETYCYNISAYDPDGDSLSYALVPCRGEDCFEMIIPNTYNYPDVVGGGNMTINPVTGTICWENPLIQGEYNIAIRISEFRGGVYIGSVIQDMQVTVRACLNSSPQFEAKADTCVFAGDDVVINFTANDAGDIVNIYATGAIFNVGTNPASFIEDTQPNSVTGQFLWSPNCNQASNSYYNFIVHAQDFDPVVQLSNLMDYGIKVNIPPVNNLTVNPLGSNMQLSWDPLFTGCEISSYKIYRSLNTSLFSDDCCAPETPENMGYEFIGTSTTTNFVDNSVTLGYEYCYLVRAVNNSGVESCVSDQVCNSLNFEVPVLTNVSVFVTSQTNGRDSIYWSWPKEIDLINFPGPFHYQLYRVTGIGGNPTALIHTTPANANIELVDTFFYDNFLNSEELVYRYRVELFSDGGLVGTSSSASSIFINLIPNDNQLEITWEENVPWTNYLYEIYRENPTGSGNFDMIGTTTNKNYTDINLINLQTYCYRIKSIGEFTQNGIRNPIENWSQINCEQPYDFTPPCPPVLEITGNCDEEKNYISWSNPNLTCSDDVVSYNLYFAPFEGDSLELLETFNFENDTVYIHEDRGSIAGCYYVTAIDSFPYLNESLPSNMVCIDNCQGYYELPNVFTPGGDGVNDIYHPILPYKFVESIHIQVFNRWGVLVFESFDPMINWDGTFLNTNKPLNDGVYFYVCEINEIKLAGIISRSIQGNITIINEK